MLSDAVIVNKLLRAGADAFINKDCGKAELLTAIGEVISGKKYISPDIAAQLFTRLTDRLLPGVKESSPGHRAVSSGPPTKTSTSVAGRHHGIAPSLIKAKQTVN